MIRVLYLVPFPMDFNLLCDRGQQLGVLKPTKMIIFRYFYHFYFHFSLVVGQVKA